MATDFRALKYFVDVATTRHYGEAAKKAGIVRQALERRMKQLQEENRVVLLRKEKGMLTLTTEGEVFLVEVKAMIKRYEDTVQLIQRSSTNRTTVRVGYMVSPTNLFLQETVSCFRQQNPSVSIVPIEVSMSECIEGMNNGRLDAAFIVRPLRMKLPGLIFRRLARYPIRLAVHREHFFAKRSTVMQSELTREIFLAFSPTKLPQYMEQFRSWWVQHPIPRVFPEYEGIDALLKAVASDQGFALLLASAEGMHPDVAFVKIDPELEIVDVGILLKANPSDIVVRLKKVAKSVCQIINNT